MTNLRDDDVADIGTLAEQALERLGQPLPSTIPAAVFCADANLWDASVLCELPDGHSGRHQATLLGGWEISRWTDGCHFDGDDCGVGAHPTEVA